MEQAVKDAEAAERSSTAEQVAAAHAEGVQLAKQAYDDTAQQAASAVGKSMQQFAAGLTALDAAVGNKLSGLAARSKRCEEALDEAKRCDAVVAGCNAARSCCTECRSKHLQSPCGSKRNIPFICRVRRVICCCAILQSLATLARKSSCKYAKSRIMMTARWRSN